MFSQASTGRSSNPHLPARPNYGPRVAAGILALAAVVWFINMRSSGGPSDKTTATDAPEYQMGVTVPIGNISYVARSAYWTNGSPYAQPDASFLCIDVTVQNNDNQSRMVPPFQLIDENGAEYDSSSKGLFFPDSIGPLYDLNPGVQKRGSVVFDVPQNHQYKLKVSGEWGAPSRDATFINITPR
jgi:hypothetical protein